MNVIKKLRPLIVVLITLVTTMGSVVAQDRLLARVEIPFSFSAFDQTFESGNYELKQIGAQVIRLRNVLNNRGVTLLTAQTIGESSATEIIFRDYGSHKFLAAVVAPSYRVRVESSRQEKELAKIASSPAREIALK